MTYWEQLNSPQLEAIDKTLPVVLPLGAVEQHGPHLPLATDRMLADHFCARLDQELGDRVLILPSLAVGFSGHHADFAGTLSVSHDTLIRQVVEIASSVLRLGMHTVLLLNAHGGNEGIAQVALERIGYEWPGRNIVRTTWWQVASSDLLEVSTTGPGGVGHACELETSLLLAIAPHLVDAAAIPGRENDSVYAWDTADMLRAGSAGRYRRFADVSSTGVFGDPRAATREKGFSVSDIVTKRLVELVSSLESR